MTETENIKEIFLNMDKDIRELAALIHNIINTGRYDKEKIEKALFLSQRITAELYRLLR